MLTLYMRYVAQWSNIGNIKVYFFRFVMKITFFLVESPAMHFFEISVSSDICRDTTVFAGGL